MGSTPTPSSPYRRSLTGPIILITLGVMFLLAELVPHWGLHKTWPVLLVVIGALKLLDASRPPRPPLGPRPYNP
jgi:membrane-bound ClpP family serine protease